MPKWRKNSWYLAVIILLLILVIGGGFLLFRKKEDDSKMTKEKLVRQPVKAGQFYPADPRELENQIDYFLEKTEPLQTEGEILALILPHAGYQFSGQVAAYGFKKLIDQDIDTVILIGNSHQEQFEGISVFKQGAFKTPLGEIEIDSELAQKIIEKDERISFRESAHSQEHSLEVQLPFLQETLKNFKIVPIIFGNSSNNDWQILAQAIFKNIKEKKVLLIASSDLSHYPSYEEAKYADSKTIEAILTGEVEKLTETIQNLERENIPNAVTFACGIDGIKTVMLVARELAVKEIKLLKYANSGDVALGDKSQVVGYATIGFFKEIESGFLNKTQQEKLLTIAKNSVESFIRQAKIPEFQVEDPLLNENLGAFVTLKKQGQLRGCIGQFLPTDIPLYQLVTQMAIAAASQDIRFYPVKENELPELDYEISVLSPLEKIDDWQKIEIGKHGVLVKQGLQTGVFLPQVATENNWDLERFMGELCSQKAGLSWDCWRSKDVNLYIFTAQVFGED